MLRPATPLSILLFASFVLLLISVISTPIIRGIPIARYQDVNFGVFGWCKDDGQCSGVRLGWNTDEALPDSNAVNSDFNLPSSTKHSLASLLIVHPIAAFFNLVALGLAIAAHFHSPSHSARYLLGLLILLLPTLLLTLLAFLVDILLFVPHLQWGGWIVLASTILITASGVVTCAMRRTLVSRKARRKRIAENAEMSGENFYNRQANEDKMTPAVSHEPKMPMVNGAPGADGLPSFATYSASRRSEDRQTAGPSPDGPVSVVSPIDTNERFYGQRSRSNSRPRQPDFSAPLGAVRSSEDGPPPMPYPPRGGYAGPRGRGGYPPRGAMSSRGSYNGRGPPSSYGARGGFMPRGGSNRGRGGFMPGPGPVPMGLPVSPNDINRGPPPPGYPPQGPQQAYDQAGPGQFQSANAGYYPPAGSAGYDLPSPSNYGPESAVGFTGAYGARAQSPAARRASPYGARSQSPRNGQRQPSSPPAMPQPVDPERYSRTASSALGYDTDIQGMMALQQDRPPMPPPLQQQQEYVPPRANWNNSQPTAPSSPPRRPRVNSGGSDYMEDVDPRFAEPAPPLPQPDQAVESRQVPSILAPGYQPHAAPAQRTTDHTHLQPHDPSPSSEGITPPSHSFEDLPGARSPVESEVSNFTSVSQRQINPNWRPGDAGDFPTTFEPMRKRQQQRRQDMLFEGNPDFEVPGMGQPGRSGMSRPPGGRGGGMGAPPSAMARGNQMMSNRPPPPSAMGDMGGDGRYPAPVPQGPASMREV